MAYKLSKRSVQNLTGVKDKLQAVVTRAIELTEVDFAVTQGLRTKEEQQQLVKAGASQTMKSKHLTGDAVDVVAFLDKRISWELPLYEKIAEAMKQAAIEQKVKIRWGAAWSVKDITKWPGTMAEAVQSYIEHCQQEGKRPFFDAPHFELA